MVDTGSRSGVADLGMPLMVVAFLAIGGFMYWLNGQAEAERALALVEDTVSEPTTGMDGARVVDPVTIQLDASGVEGELITLEALEVQGMLGTQGFWIGMPNGNPFLVSMSEDVMAEGLSLSQGSGATVSGVVYAIGDSVLNAWTAAGTIGDGERLQAEFATHFMEAQDVEVIGGSGAGN